MDRSTAGVFDTPLPTLINIWLKIGNPPIILVYPPIPSILVQIPKPHTKKPAPKAGNYINSLTKSKY